MMQSLDRGSAGATASAVSRDGEMQKNGQQEKRCYDLLRRISALEIQEVHAYAQSQVDAFSVRKKPPVKNIGEELDYTRLILAGVLKDIPPLNDDETESSSEDESCDELDIGTRRIENYLPIAEAPGSKWAQDRGSIASAWSWLQYGISDVTFRMKQHEELLKHFRASKQPVAVDDKFRSDPARIPTAPSLIDAQIQIYKAGPELDQQNPTMSASSKMTRNSGGIRGKFTHPLPIPVDSFLPPNYAKQYTTTNHNRDLALLSGGTSSDNSLDPNKHEIGGGLEALRLKFAQQHDPTYVARRCLPSKQIRPRKIYRVNNLVGSDSEEHVCNCDGLQVCAKCYLKRNRARPRVRSLAARLDYSFHRNLSFPDDIAIPVLLDASIKAEGWKENAPRNKSTFRKVPLQCLSGYERLNKRNSSNITADQSRKGRQRQMRRPDEVVAAIVDRERQRAAASASHRSVAAKSGRRASAGEVNGLKKNLSRRRKCNSTSSAQKRKRQSLEYDSDELYTEVSISTTPAGSSRTQGPGRPRLAEKIARRKRDQTDINSIVIPHSMAAATRIEKLEYKEIVTPSWRAVPWYMDLLKRKGTGSLPSDGIINGEDMSEEAYIVRHARCEVEEQRRFMLAMKPISRRSRRTDSKTEAVDPLSAPESPKAGDMMPASPSVGADEATAKNSQIVTAVAATMAAAAVKTPGRKRQKSLKEVVEMEYEDDGGEWEEEGGFERRTFPLPESEYERMCAEMPDGFFDTDCKKLEMVAVKVEKIERVKDQEGQPGYSGKRRRSKSKSGNSEDRKSRRLKKSKSLK